MKQTWRCLFSLFLSFFLFAQVDSAQAQTLQSLSEPSIDPQCFRRVETGVYQVVCSTEERDEIWIMPGNSHVLILLTGRISESTDWMQAVSRQWPTQQVQILNLRVSCQQLHANQRLAAWFSLPVKQSASGQFYSMSVLTTHAQFAQFDHQCLGKSGLVFPGGGLKSRRGDLTSNFDVQDGWKFSLEPDTQGGNQLVVVNSAKRVALLPAYVELADAPASNGTWPFNRFAFWVNKQAHDGYRVIDRSGEVSLEVSRNVLDQSIARQIEQASVQVSAPVQANRQVQEFDTHPH